MSDSSHIRIDRPEVQGDRRIGVRVDVSPDLRRYVCGPLYFEYDRPVEGVPEQLAIIPAVSHLAPLAWAMDATLAVPVLDRTFHRQLPLVKDALAEMFTRMDFRGRIDVDEVVDTESESEPGAAMSLFSGGVDALHTALRHRDEHLTLVNIRGIDVRTSNESSWRRVRERTTGFARAQGLRTAFVKTNAREAVNERRLSRRFDGAIRHWWTVSIGLGLLGITAPLTYVTGSSTVYIASGVTESFENPIGYHPTIDNHVGWSTVTCVHDGFGVGRPEKQRLIGEQAPGQELLVCLSGSDGDGRNCSWCEKCLRTIVGFLVVGVDPRKHGFRVDERSLSNLRESMGGGALTFGGDATDYWKDVQRAIGTTPAYDLEGSAELFAWLRGVDLDVVRRRWEDRTRLRRRVRSVLGPLVPERFRRTARRLYGRVFRDP
jgi:hypothetical protein